MINFLFFWNFLSFFFSPGNGKKGKKTIQIKIERFCVINILTVSISVLCQVSTHFILFYCFFVLFYGSNFLKRHRLSMEILFIQSILFSNHHVLTYFSAIIIFIDLNYFFLGILNL